MQRNCMGKRATDGEREKGGGREWRQGAPPSVHIHAQTNACNTLHPIPWARTYASTYARHNTCQACAMPRCRPSSEHPLQARTLTPTRTQTHTHTAPPTERERETLHTHTHTCCLRDRHGMAMMARPTAFSRRDRERERQAEIAASPTSSSIRHHPDGCVAHSSVPCQCNTQGAQGKPSVHPPQTKIMWQARLQLEAYQLSHG